MWGKERQEARGRENGKEECPLIRFVERRWEGFGLNLALALALDSAGEEGVQVHHVGSRVTNQKICLAGWLAGWQVLPRQNGMAWQSPPHPIPLIPARPASRQQTGGLEIVALHCLTKSVGNPAQQGIHSLKSQLPSSITTTVVYESSLITEKPAAGCRLSVDDSTQDPSCAQVHNVLFIHSSLVSFPYGIIDACCLVATSTRIKEQRIDK